MPSKRTGATALAGNVVDQSPLAVLMVDVINAFDFPGAESLVEAARKMASNLADLCSQARKRGIPIIYANDNFGRWRSNLNDIVNECQLGRGRDVVRRLKPHRNDYFVLKPKNSAFYATNLDLLLHHIGAKKLILGGVLADNCVLFSANDAYMRDYRIIVPADCVASVETEHKEIALRQIERVLKGDIRPWKLSVRFPRRKHLTRLPH